MRVWIKCASCLNVEASLVPDTEPHAIVRIYPCGLCGSEEIVLADYHPPDEEAA